jgi:hypothetical protein
VRLAWYRISSFGLDVRSSNRELNDRRLHEPDVVDRAVVAGYEAC